MVIISGPVPQERSKPGATNDWSKKNEEMGVMAYRRIPSE
jgi:hypothetical protein